MKNDLRLKIEYLPPESLTPYEGNARVHEEYDINAIKQSITDTGFNDPIGIWGENNLIVEGHGRRIAAMELGLNSVPCIRLDHMTEEQRKEYALVHNKTAELSRWDFGKLEEELASLKIDMSDFEFTIETTKEPEQKERKEAKYSDSISVIVECDNDEQAEEVYNRLTEEGYTCRISTL